MKRRVYVLLAAVLWTAGLAGSSARAVMYPSTARLVFEAERFDKQVVEVSGNARKVKTKTSKSGREYTVFRLEGADRKWVRVFSWGRPDVYEGRWVTVVGTFHAVKKIGKWTFKREIEATEIR